MFQNFSIQQSIVENGHRFAMLSASAMHNQLGALHEIVVVFLLFKFAPFISNNEEDAKNKSKKLQISV